MNSKKDVHMDTLMAYHNYLQGRIKENLNSLYLGPGKFYFVISIILFIVSLISMMVGILVITLRHRHVYLVNFDYKFVGPGFIVLFILCLGVGSHFLLHAKRVTNKYRRNLRFLPMGDYGVQVVHVTQVAKKEKQKEGLKTGHLQHITPPAPRGHTRSYSSNPSGSMGDLSRRDGSSIGYRSDRSHASTPDLTDKPSSRYIRGRRDPHFQPRPPPSDKSSEGKTDSVDGSRASEPRDGSREREPRDVMRPRGHPQGRPPYRGGPHHRGGGPPRGPPLRDPRDFDPAHRGRGRGGPGPRGRGRGGPRGPPRGEPGYRGGRSAPATSDESSRIPRRAPVEYDTRGQPPPARRDPGPLAYSSDDSRNGRKIPLESSSESEL